MRVALVLPWMYTIAGGACFLPPSLEPEVEADASPNTIPVIVDTSFQPTGVLDIQRQGQQPVTLTVRDLDESDTTYVYFYVDYGYPDPTPPLNGCEGGGPQIDRVLSCPINSLCSATDSVPDQRHFLEAVVADRELLLNGTSLFRTFPEGTGISYRSWLMTCVDSL